jgi:hypothetical protein
MIDDVLGHAASIAHAHRTGPTQRTGQDGEPERVSNG